MAIANADKVWIHICYFVEFEKNGEGIWTRKYLDDDENMKVISVEKSISYDELYQKVIEKLKINSMLYELEMRCESPIPSKYPELPMKIDCDESVAWLVEFSDRTKLNITLKKKVIGIEGTFVNSLEESQKVVIDDDGRDGCGIGGESLELNRPEENDNVAIDKSPQGDSAAVDPLLTSFGGGVELHAWGTNNINDDISDIDSSDSSDSSDDGSFGEHARENDFIEDTLGGNTNGSNSQEASTMISTGTAVRIPEEFDICDGELFESKDLLIHKLQMMELKAHFEFKTITSTREIYVVKCGVEQCGWRVRAVKLHTEASEQFQVRIYEGKHSCSLSVRQKDHKHASYMFIGRHYLRKFLDINHTYRAKDIIRDFRDEFGYTIKKGRANKAKWFAFELIHGKAAESYEKLPKYCHMLKVHNPGTKTCIRTNKETNRFQYFFMALGACILGFQSSIRPVICVDGTHLKSQYKGTLLVAMCQDANKQLYPLAWGVVNAENNKSWTWFFKKLKTITGDTDELVIVSDRASSIKRGFETVFKNAHHCYCAYHIRSNLETKFPRCGIGKLFWRASKAYTEHEFSKAFSDLCGVKPTVNGVNPVEEYLKSAPFRYWSRAHFDGLRYNMMTTNNAESLNGLLSRAREFCIVSLLEEIRKILQNWFAERRNTSTACHTFLTQPYEEKMVKRYNEAAGLTIGEVRHPKYEVSKDLVSHVVDLEEMTCSCKVFDLDKFPCPHAMTAGKEIGKTGYDFCTPYYTTGFWRRSYSEAICPLIAEQTYDFPDDVLRRKVLAPLVEKNPSGRPPSKKRKLSSGDRRFKRVKRCGRCNESDGHDIRTCSAFLS